MFFFISILIEFWFENGTYKVASEKKKCVVCALCVCICLIFTMINRALCITKKKLKENQI